MSVVLVSATKNYIVFMSDGRVMHEDDNGNTIIQKEDYKKLLRINDSVCVGYTGDKDICECILGVLNNFNQDELNLENVVEILWNVTKNSYNVNNIIGRNISIIVGGISSSKDIEFYSFATKYNLNVEHHKLIDEGIEYAILCSDAISNDNVFERHLRRVFSSTDSKTIINAMENCINEISKKDNTVNTTKFKEVINKNV